MPVHAGKLIAFCYCVKPYHVIGHTVIAVSMNRNNLNEMFHKYEYILLTHIQSGAMMRVRKKEISVMVVFAGNKDEFLSAIRQLKPEDCVEIDSFASVAGSAGDMLSAIVSIDGKRADFISIKEKRNGFLCLTIVGYFNPTIIGQNNPMKNGQDHPTLTTAQSAIIALWRNWQF